MARALHRMIPVLLAMLATQAPAPARSAPRQEQPSAEAVNAAIDRGVAFLLRSQNRDGSFGVDLYERGTPWHAFRDGASSLALYTLVHCGLAPDHPARRRAQAFLFEEWPTHTYSIGAQLLALGAMGDAEVEERMEELLDRLLELEKSGGWDYPGFGAPPDLSNTQVAVLGLWAAEKAGMRVPRSTWTAAAEAALRHQVKPEQIEIDGCERECAGFCYTLNDLRPTAARTTAGLSILGLALHGPERVSPGLRARIEEARDRGLTWLEANYSIEGNPSGSAKWHFYYLYGLERVGALHGIERFGEHDWYREGTLQLLKEQRDEGGWWSGGRSVWPPSPMPIANTCFALLFLRRATITKPGLRPLSFHASEDADSEVWIRVDAKRRWVLWLSDLPRAKEEARLAVHEVEWWIDGELFTTVGGDPEQPWEYERFAVRFEPTRAEHEVECRVRAAAPCEPRLPGEKEPELLELRSKKLQVHGTALLEPWMLEYARSQSHNLLADARMKVEASSEESRYHSAGDAIDGLQGSAWLARPEDEAPWIRLELRRPIRAREILLSPAGASEILRRTCARLVRVELVIDGAKRTIPVDMNQDERRKTCFELPRSRMVHELEVRIVDAEPEAGRLVGLAEIEIR